MTEQSGQQQQPSEIMEEAEKLRFNQRGVAEAEEDTNTAYGLATLRASGVLSNEGASQAELDARVDSTGQMHRNAKGALSDKEQRAREHFEDNKAVYVETAKQEAEASGHTISEDPDVATKVRVKDPRGGYTSRTTPPWRRDNDKPGFIKV